MNEKKNQFRVCEFRLFLGRMRKGGREDIYSTFIHFKGLKKENLTIFYVKNFNFNINFINFVLGFRQNLKGFFSQSYKKKLSFVIFKTLNDFSIQLRFAALCSNIFQQLIPVSQNHIWIQSRLEIVEFLCESLEKKNGNKIDYFHFVLMKSQKDYAFIWNLTRLCKCSCLNAIDTSRRGED